MYLKYLSKIYINYIYPIKNKRSVRLTELMRKEQRQKRISLDSVLFCYLNSFFSTVKAVTALALSTDFTSNTPVKRNTTFTSVGVLERNTTFTSVGVLERNTTGKFLNYKKSIIKYLTAFLSFYTSQKFHAAV